MFPKDISHAKNGSRLDYVCMNKGCDYRCEISLHTETQTIFRYYLSCPTTDSPHGVIFGLNNEYTGLKYTFITKHEPDEAGKSIFLQTIFIPSLSKIMAPMPPVPLLNCSNLPPLLERSAIVRLIIN
jgi:hypothetical protein